MFVTFRGSLAGIAVWQWRPIALFVGVSTTTVAVAPYVPLWLLDMTHLPALPLGVVGGAIGIFVSFRTNSAYDRWWEGRKLWGGLVNASRHFATQVLTYVRAAPDENKTPTQTQERLVKRHVLYVHVLRCILREQDPWADADVKSLLEPGELALYRGRTNVAHAILHKQAEELAEHANSGRLEELRLQKLDDTLRVVLDMQGGCERIKKTPFPRGYGYIADRLILAYGILLPLGLVEDMGWLTIPMTVLVCMSFLLIGEVGRTLEDPFTTFWPALPLSALSTTIELNLRDVLGEKNLPPMPKPIPPGILM